MVEAAFFPLEMGMTFFFAAMLPMDGNIRIIKASISM